jgi:hypothetical protein
MKTAFCSAFLLIYSVTDILLQQFRERSSVQFYAACFVIRCKSIVNACVRVTTDDSLSGETIIIFLCQSVSASNFLR